MNILASATTSDAATVSANLGAVRAVVVTLVVIGITAVVALVVMLLLGFDVMPSLGMVAATGLFAVYASVTLLGAVHSERVRDAASVAVSKLGGGEIDWKASGRGEFSPSKNTNEHALLTKDGEALVLTLDFEENTVTVSRVQSQEPSSENANDAGNVVKHSTTDVITEAKE